MITLYNLYFWKFYFCLTFKSELFHIIPNISLFYGIKNICSKQLILTLSFLTFELQITFDKKFNYKFEFIKEKY
jgi:hypothetical protein